MFGAQCYFDEEVRESQGLVRASLEAMLGAWCWRKPLSTDMGPPAAGLAATIATDTTSDISICTADAVAKFPWLCHGSLPHRISSARQFTRRSVLP